MHQICDLDKNQNRHRSKSIWVVLPKWFSYKEIILAKGQLDHSYTFWAMPIMIFSPVANLMHYPLGRSKRVQKCQTPFMDVPKGTKAVFKILLELTLKV